MRYPGVVILSIALGLAAIPARGGVTGDQLRQWCDAWDRVFVRNLGSDAQDVANAASCSAFIAGTLEGAGALSLELLEIEGSVAPPPAIGLCHPRDEDYRTLIEAVRRYLERPAYRSEANAASLVLEAIRAAFPCEQA